MAMQGPNARREADQVVDATPPSTDRIGPVSDLEAVVRRASPARLVARLAMVVVLLGGPAACAWFGRDAWKERKAKHAPMASVAGGPVKIGNDRGPETERPAHTVTLAPFEIDLTEVTVGAYAVCVKRGKCSP